MIARVSVGIEITVARTVSAQSSHATVPRVTSDRVSANQLALQVPGPGEDCAVCRRLLQESYSPVFSVAVVSPAAGAAQTQGSVSASANLPASTISARAVAGWGTGEPS